MGDEGTSAAIHQASPGEKRTILLTGFEKWGNVGENPSGVVARKLDGAEFCGVRVTSVVLPVLWGEGVALLRDQINKHKPDAVVSLGVAPGSASIAIERIAVNLQNGTDANGVEREDDCIVKGGQPGYFATLPTRSMQTMVQSVGIPCSLSYSAGTFLCNAVMYTSAHASEEEPDSSATSGMVSGFIHVPLLPSDVARRHPKGGGQPSMALEITTAGVSAALGVVAKHISQRKLKPSLVRPVE